MTLCVYARMGMRIQSATLQTNETQGQWLGPRLMYNTCELLMVDVAAATLNTSVE